MKRSKRQRVMSALWVVVFVAFVAFLAFAFIIVHFKCETGFFFNVMAQAAQQLNVSIDPCLLIGIAFFFIFFIFAALYPIFGDKDEAV